MKKNSPVTLTNTEILCYAIRHLESEINDIQAKVCGMPGAEEMLRIMTSRELQHLDLLKVLYKVETGTDYGG